MHLARLATSSRFMHYASLGLDEYYPFLFQSALNVGRVDKAKKLFWSAVLHMSLKWANTSHFSPKSASKSQIYPPDPSKNCFGFLAIQGHWEKGP